MPSKIKLSAENQPVFEKSIKEGEHIMEYSGEIRDMLDRKYPDKMLFDIRTVSLELSCSYEFLRARIIRGTIKHIKLGASKMIPRSEVIKLLTVGVS
jgi:hypothetical protein